MTHTERLAKPSTWFLAAAGFATGVALVPLAALPARWVTALAAGALAVPAVLLTGRPRRAALFLFAFSLQIGLSLYLTDPPPGSRVGASWPTSLALPLPTLTAIVALRLGRRRFFWGGGISAATLLLLLTTAASIPGSPVRFVGICHLVVLGAYFLIFLAAANAIEDRRDLRLVQTALMASLALECVVYGVQSLTGATFTPAGEWIEPVGGELGRYGGLIATRPAGFASFLLPLLLLAVADFLTGRGRRWSALLSAIGGVTLALTFTRAAWSGFALGLAYLLVAGLRRRMLAPRNVAVLIAILLAVLAAVSGQIVERVHEDHGADFQERWALVQMALNVVRANPLAGVGAGAYSEVFRDYLTPELAGRWLFVVHNAYVLRAAETGLPGLAALLVFLWVAFRRASPERMRDPAHRALALGWRAGLIALAWEMLWDISLGPPATSLLWFLCGLTARAEQLEPEPSPEAS